MVFLWKKDIRYTKKDGHYCRQYNLWDLSFRKLVQKMDPLYIFLPETLSGVDVFLYNMDSGCVYCRRRDNIYLEENSIDSETVIIPRSFIIKICIIRQAFYMDVAMERSDIIHQS